MAVSESIAIYARVSGKAALPLPPIFGNGPQHLRHHHVEVIPDIVNNSGRPYRDA